MSTIKSKRRVPKAMNLRITDPTAIVYLAARAKANKRAASREAECVLLEQIATCTVTTTKG